MRHQSEIDAILKQVEVLDADERRWLGEQLITSAGARPPRPPIADVFVPPVGRLRSDEEKRELSRRFFERYGGVSNSHGGPSTLANLVGIANPEGREFTDEEVDRLRSDTIAEKHLR